MPQARGGRVCRHVSPLACATKLFMRREANRLEDKQQHHTQGPKSFDASTGNQRFWRAASMRSIRSSIIGLDDRGIMRKGAQNTILSPNTVDRRSNRVTCGGL